MWYIWLIISGICLIIEIMTVGFLVFWFSIGALITMIASFFTNNIVVQTAIFVISSTILIFTTKPFVKRFANTKDSIKTNVYSIIGKTGVVTKQIDSNTCIGQIKVSGEIWSAICINDSKIPVGTKVKILDVNGVKAVVTPI